MSEEPSQPEPQPRVGGEEAQPPPVPTEETAPAEDAQPNVTAPGEDPPPTEGDGAAVGDADAVEGGKDGSGDGGDTTTDAAMEEAAPGAEAAGEDGGGGDGSVAGTGPSSSAEAPATGDGDKDAGGNKEEVEAAGGSGGGRGDDAPKITTRPGPALPPPLDDIQMVNVSGVTAVDDGGGGGVKVEKARHLVEINCEGFTPEQLARLPVAFAYRLDDGGESERAAMIAQDEWYRQRRMEKEEAMARQSRAAAASAATQKKSKPAPHKKTAEKKPAKPDATGRVRPYEIESIPAPDAPPGWIRKTFNRKTGDHVDKYWYTPKTSKKLRSKTEVNRFIQYLERTGGDEDDAFDMLKNKPVGTSKRRSK